MILLLRPNSGILQARRSKLHFYSAGRLVMDSGRLFDSVVLEGKGGGAKGVALPLKKFKIFIALSGINF